jgi:hypothetical protein
MIFDPAKYPVGSKVQVADRAVLEDFFANWTLHNKLKRGQLEYAGKVAKVKRSYMYHGGDILYELKGIPGIWHEQCLGEAPAPTRWWKLWGRNS